MRIESNSPIPSGLIDSSLSTTPPQRPNNAPKDTLSEDKQAKALGEWIAAITMIFAMACCLLFFIVDAIRGWLKLTGRISSIVCVGILFPSFISSWDEDPRIKEHNLLTEKLIALGDCQAGLKTHSENFIEEKCKKEIKKLLDNTPKRSENNDKSSDD